MIKQFVKPLAVCAMISSLLLTSCQKDYFDPESVGTVVSKDACELDFSTTQDVQFDLSYASYDGYIAAYQFYAENPCESKGYGTWVLKEGVKPIASGVAISGKYDNTKQLPSYVEKLYAYSSDMFSPRLLQATIVGGKAKFEIVPETTSRAVGSQTRSVADSNMDKYLGQYGTAPDNNAFGKPNYIDNNKIVNIPSDILQRINSAFPEGKHGLNEMFYTDVFTYVQEEAEVWVCLLKSEGMLTSELAYYYYENGTFNSLKLSDVKLISAFNKAKVNTTDADGLKVGQYVKLKYYKDGKEYDKFPANTIIGWALRPSNNGTYLGNTFYSCSMWNPEAQLKNHTTYFNAGSAASPFTCFGFEDMRNDKLWNNWGDNDCNDVIFNIQSNPVRAIETPPVIGPVTPITLSQTYTGYLGFEDYWPLYYDYDMNDVLVKYKSEVFTVTETGTIDTKATTRAMLVPTYVNKIEDEFTMVFSGADFNDKFGYVVNINPATIDKVIINNVETLGSNLTKEGNGFIIDLCPNARAVLVPYDYNTAPKTYKVTMIMKSKVLNMADFEASRSMAPYNPFITPIGEQRNGNIEVHLVGYKPTSRVDMSLFGTSDDRSDISKGKYYVGGAYKLDEQGNPEEANIFPFAIHLSGIEDLYIPRERVRIDKMFPKYRSWAESNMTVNKDWYKYPNTEIE